VGLATVLDGLGAGAGVPVAGTPGSRTLPALPRVEVRVLFSVKVLAARAAAPATRTPATESTTAVLVFMAQL
jgi:hypothetical protein